MNVEYIWDTPEVIVGQISALKLLGYSDRDAAAQITDWGFQIGRSTVNRQWKKYHEQDVGHNRENSGRKALLDEEQKQEMIDRVKFDRWETAASLARD